MRFTPYGNADAGDYPAVFTTYFDAQFPKAMRLIYGFTILNLDRRTPHDGPNGEGLYVVAVCNKSQGNNPKSKPYKIRRAMLQPEEFSKPEFIMKMPEAEHFLEPFDGDLRVIDIRVIHRGIDGKRVSIVTDVCRPRDGVWQSIEGVYEGKSHVGAAGATRVVPTKRPYWLQEDGRAIRYDDHLPKGSVAPQDRQAWLIWNQTTPDQLAKWINPDGTLIPLSEEDVAKLESLDPHRYQVARIRAALGMLDGITPTNQEAEIIAAPGLQPVDVDIDELAAMGAGFE